MKLPFLDTDAGKVNLFLSNINILTGYIRAPASKSEYLWVMSLLDHLSELGDPRAEGRCKRRMSDILVISLADYYYFLLLLSGKS